MKNLPKTKVIRKGYSLPFKRMVAETYTSTTSSAKAVGEQYGCHPSQVYYWSTQLFQGLLEEQYAVAFSRRPSANVGRNAGILGLTRGKS